jgi:hypothetical protein
MASQLTEVELIMAVGEDCAWQIFWTDEDDEPIPIADPVLADVKDANGQLVIRFSSQNDPVEDAYIEYSGFIGFFQLTVPRSRTQLLLPGRYSFDLFAAVADSSGPFSNDRQVQQVVTGWFVANRRRTKLEQATEALLSSTPLGSG